MDLIKDFTSLEIFYLICAVIGGALFAVRLILQFIGLGHDIDVDHGGDFHMDSDASFKILSLQGITAFFMMFGLVGLALFRQSGVGKLLSLFGASAAGLFAMWVIAKLFSMMIGLQADGTAETKDAVGAEGSVYLNIPAGGTGKVQIKIKGRLREYEAVAENEVELKTGESIRVVFLKGELLVVEKI